MRELALHLLDLIQNSLAAGADHLRLEVRLDAAADLLTLKVEDNGRGISPAVLPRVTDAFVTGRKTRRVGLGLALLKAAAERAGGGISISSREGEGTTVTATFRAGHVDRAPVGDLAGTVMTALACNPGVKLDLIVSWDGGEFVFSSSTWDETAGPASWLELRHYLTTRLAPFRAADEAAMGLSTEG